MKLKAVIWQAYKPFGEDRECRVVFCKHHHRWVNEWKALIVRGKRWGK